MNPKLHYGINFVYSINSVNSCFLHPAQHTKYSKESHFGFSRYLVSYWANSTSGFLQEVMPYVITQFPADAQAKWLRWDACPVQSLF